MRNFIWYNPTKVYFGKNQINQLEDELTKYNSILFVYGSRSIKKSGLYQEVLSKLEKTKVKVTELHGIQPNPRIEKVREGIELCKNHNVDLILAVGGGSVIDTAKAIAVGVLYDGDVWDIVSGKVKAEKGIDIGTILTLSATGTEMNCRSVITDWDNNLKLGHGNWENDSTFPNFSILDPTYTMSVSKSQTANGVFDMFAHVIEQYFHDNDNAVLTDRIAEQLMKTIIENGTLLINDLENYQLRETIMYCGTMAWNGMLRAGVSGGDWSCHTIEHALSAVYDIPHGSGLAIIIPAWMKHIKDSNNSKLISLAINVYEANPNLNDDELAEIAIYETERFISQLELPLSLSHYQIKEDSFDLLVDKSLDKPIGKYKLLSKEDVKDILTKCR